MLGVVDSNLKMVQFFTQHLWMLRDFVVVWPGLCTILRQGMRSGSNLNSQYVATRRFAGACKYTGPTMLR